MRKQFQIMSLIVFLTFAISENAFAQAAQDRYGEKAVSDALSAGGMTLSHFEKETNALGDRAAVGIMRLLDRKALENPQEIKNVLLILEQAFAAPPVIAFDGDRKPRVTLFLLDCLQSMPASRGLEANITRTRDFVIQASKNTSNETKVDHTE